MGTLTREKLSGLNLGSVRLYQAVPGRKRAMLGPVSYQAEPIYTRLSRDGSEQRLVRFRIRLSEFIPGRPGTEASRVPLGSGVEVGLQ